MCKAVQEDRLYKIVPVHTHEEHALISATKVEDRSIDLWHKRTGHLNVKSLATMVDRVTGMKITSGPKFSFCESCLDGKHHKGQES